MSSRRGIAPVRVLPESVANKIAAGEVVERPASVVKELVENALDAQATRITVRVVAAGRRLIEVVDNGHGMSEQDALLAVERHATSKIRRADDLDNIATLGFRGEALASIAAVSRFELVTRRERDEAATRVQIDGGVMRETSKTGAKPGTRVSVNRLYFNTPVRAKFLKGITTELSHCIDIVQRHALAHEGVGFQFFHNDKLILDIPEHADLRERVALIWGLSFLRDMVEISGEQAGFAVRGLIGTPALTRSSRSHQFFFVNGRPVVNRTLQYGFEDGYHGLLTIGRHPVGVVLMTTHPRNVDVNIHPTKREIRFREERAVREAVRSITRSTLESLKQPAERIPRGAAAPDGVAAAAPVHPRVAVPSVPKLDRAGPMPPAFTLHSEEARAATNDAQAELPIEGLGQLEPRAVYAPVGHFEGEPIQLFDTYLMVEDEDRLLIIDQHALHERLNYDDLVADLRDANYAAQQLVVPVLVEVPPAHARLLESNLELFRKLGIEMESFGGNTFQITAICHLYDEAKVVDVVHRIIDDMAQGNLFDREDYMTDMLRLATEACRASVKAGDRLSAEEKRELLEGFRRMRPPYTCPHGRPIITEVTLSQMEKSFRRRQ